MLRSYTPRWKRSIALLTQSPKVTHRSIRLFRVERPFGLDDTVHALCDPVCTLGMAVHPWSERVTTQGPTSITRTTPEKR